MDHTPILQGGIVLRLVDLCEICRGCVGGRQILFDVNDTGNKTMQADRQSDDFVDTQELTSMMKKQRRAITHISQTTSWFAFVTGDTSINFMSLAF
ncbi:hypothetical protein JOB18_014378 [Solea senegalensis]|uniref:Uncharacterized protein n=1 Tax=Solea senegalensis TaxID=28829 RepID=A0AAV6SKT0_SOLSE|nr:hypothetical protein JOB18_014378 [Solea senegalensis]